MCVLLASSFLTGTGAEVTRNGVLCSPEHRVKASIRAATMLPTVALVDPSLTLSLPATVTSSTGLDAFTQVRSTLEYAETVYAVQCTLTSCRFSIGPI